ncbi:MAG: hypothetical protein HZB98_06190 [Bacteroidia bacterium]|nr:hypothetical protein [Bacteroidia bacterium]
MAIEFEDSKKLRIRFYSVIINVSGINKAYGRVYDFCKKYDITAITNGELLIIYFMSYPGDDQISDILRLGGLKYNKDFIIAQEELVFGVGNQPSSGLGYPLNPLENISWLGSVLKEDGNWVWKI